MTALSAQIPLGASVLDIGCGSGEIASDLADEGRSLRGVDTLARDVCAVEMVTYDGQTLPFDDNTFEWATIIDVLHHASDPERVLAEARRVTTAGIVLKDHFAERRRHHLTLAVMDWVGNRQFGVGRDGRYLSRDEWSEMFDSAGLNVADQNEQIDLYPAPIKPLFESGLHFLARLEHATD